MAKHPARVPFTTITLNGPASTPLYRQLYDGLRRAILTGQLIAGTRLPSTRVLSAELSVSRNTVMNAFEQLLAEGYLEGKVGAGTFVSRALPDEMLHARADVARTPRLLRQGRALSQRGASIAATPVTVTRSSGKPRAFRMSLPAFEAFPLELWARLVARRWRRPTSDLLGYGDPAGYRPLREAIAAYLGVARAVRCKAEQVIVVAGAQQALDLAARVLLDPGDAAWIEDPGYLGARGALLGAGARLVPVPVDKEGLNVAAGVTRGADARLVYVSPSHQLPLGVTMSLARRLALLEWASHSGAWVLEDDYDSEYRYAGRPLAALQGLDHEARVIYLGSFSKVLFPSLRIGYLVVPSDLVEAFTAARALVSRHSPSLEQAVLADFIAEGHFARHIRRMRKLYGERQAVLVEAAERELAGRLEIGPAEAGMHLVGWLPAEVNDRVASQQAATFGVEAQPLSSYRLKPARRGGLVLGYTGFGPKEIREGVRLLAAALKAAAQAPRSSARLSSVTRADR